MTHRSLIGALLALCIALSIGLAGPVVGQAAEGAAPTAAVLVVDADGGEYTTIQSAVDDAAPGDTIRVLPGTYRESVTLTTDVTVSAPRGATMNGSGLTDVDAAFTIEDDAAPVVQGVTIMGYPMGVKAYSTGGNWTVRNTTFRNLWRGIGTVYSTGDWRVEDVTIRNVSSGIDVGNAEGDWTVADVTISNVTEGRGVDAVGTTGDWTVRNTTITDVDFVGVAASYSTGDWRVVNSTLRDTLVGVSAIDASGDWLVRGSTITNASTSGRYDFWQPPLTEGVAIDARGTNGSWTVTRTRFTEIDVAGVHAPDAAPAGDATGNWFENTTDGEVCTGNVDCSDRLETWPPDSAVSPASPTPSATANPPASPTPSPLPLSTEPKGKKTGTSSPGTPTQTPTTAPLSVLVVIVGLLAAALVETR